MILVVAVRECAYAIITRLLDWVANGRCVLEMQGFCDDRVLGEIGRRGQDELAKLRVGTMFVGDSLGVANILYL